jgi:hypothetical protein
MFLKIWRVMCMTIEGSVSDSFPSRFLKAEDVRADAKVIITDVKKEKVGEDEKPVVYFEGVDKGLVLNKTNGLRIAKIVKSDKYVDWPGQPVVLYTAEVQFHGEDVPALRVKAPVAPETTPIVS